MRKSNQLSRTTSMSVRALTLCLAGISVTIISTGLSAARRAPAPTIPRVDSVYLNLPDKAVIAHRGAADDEARQNGFHEGTLEAYYYAANLNVDVLEMDIHKTADNRLALHHDDELPATCSGKDKISELSMSALKSCRTTLGYEIPELKELFQHFPGYRMTIEMKTPNNSLIKRYEGIENLLWNEINAYNMGPYVSVSSVNSTTIKNFRNLVDGVPTGLSVPEQVSFLLCYIARLPEWACAGFPDDTHVLEPPFLSADIAFWGLDLGSIGIVTSSFADWSHKYGMRLHYWTVNEVSNMNKAFNTGADGVITDNPARALSVR